MDIMISIHNVWIEKIFSGRKPFEFRTKLPKELKTGSTVYIYETSKNGGRKKVVGEFKVKNIKYLLSDEDKWPMYGCFNFIDYYFTHVNPNPDYAKAFKDAKEMFGAETAPYHISRHRYGAEINYALSPDDIESLKVNQKPCRSFDAEGPYEPKSKSPNLLTRLIGNREKNQKAIEECDAWLREIGFYNEYDESCYKYSIAVSDVVKYDEPKDVSEFTSVKTGLPVAAAPQSFIYVKKE